MTDDFLGSLGHLALGSRLKRAGTLLQSATQTWLRAHGCNVPAGQLPLMVALDEAGTASLGTLVNRLGLAQPGVTRMADSLENAGWIRTGPVKGDKRVRVLELTPKGRDLVTSAKKDLWPVIQDAVGDLCANLDGPLTHQLIGLESKLSAGAFEDALARRSGKRKTRA